MSFFGESDKKRYSNELIKAIRDGNYSEVSVLIDKGADIEARDEYGYTPFLIACNIGRIEIAKILVNKGADITLKNQTKETSLYLASRNGNNERIYYI